MYIHKREGLETKADTVHIDRLQTNIALLYVLTSILLSLWYCQLIFPYHNGDGDNWHDQNNDHNNDYSHNFSTCKKHGVNDAC